MVSAKTNVNTVSKEGTDTPTLNGHSLAADSSHLRESALKALNNEIKFDEIVDIRTMLTKDPARAQKLMEQGYKIYCEAFPDPDERESLENLVGYLKNPNMNWRMYLVIKDGQVIGGRNVNILDAKMDEGSIRFGFGEHLYVDPASRMKGMGSEIVRQTNEMASRDHKIGMFLSEQNDPYIMTRKEIAIDSAAGIDPVSRLKFWGKQGYQAIDAPYSQPSLDGGDPVYYLRCCCAVVAPHHIPEIARFNGTSISAAAYLAMIRAYHSTFVEDMDGDLTSRYLAGQISLRDRVNLIPIDQEREFRQIRLDRIPKEDLGRI